MNESAGGVGVWGGIVRARGDRRERLEPLGLGLKKGNNRKLLVVIRNAAEYDTM